MLCSNVMTRFVNYEMKIGITKKLIADVTMLLSWVDNNVVNKCIGKDSVMD